MGFNLKSPYMKKFLLGGMLLALVSSGCKKSDANCDRTMANIAGTYHLTSLKYKSSSSAIEVEIYSMQDACSKDDFIVFSANGQYAYNDAGVSCNPNDSYSSTWSLSGNNITVDGDLATIVSFDCKTLVVTTTDNSNGETSTATLVKN